MIRFWSVVPDGGGRGSDKANLLLVKSTKDGRRRGPKLLKSVGDDLIDSVLTSNYGINLEQEKYNEALTSSVKRVAAVLEGREGREVLRRSTRQPRGVILRLVRRRMRSVMCSRTSSSVYS